MGHKNSKVEPRQLNKGQFELLLKKLKLKTKMVMGRREGKRNQRELALKKLVFQKVRHQQDEYLKGSAIVGDNQFIHGCQICLRFLDVLLDKSMNIVESQGDPGKVKEITKYLISTIWGGKKLNIQDYNELESMMVWFFGHGVAQSLQKKEHVDPELNSLFINLLPTSMQINRYFGDFCERKDIDMCKFNAIGHEAFVGQVHQNIQHPNGSQMQNSHNTQCNDMPNSNNMLPMQNLEYQVPINNQMPNSNNMLPMQNQQYQMPNNNQMPNSNNQFNQVPNNNQMLSNNYQQNQNQGQGKQDQDINELLKSMGNPNNQPNIVDHNINQQQQPMFPPPQNDDPMKGIDNLLNQQNNNKQYPDLSKFEGNNNNNNPYQPQFPPSQ